MRLQLDTHLIRSHLPRLVDLADVFDRSFSYSASGVEHRALIGWYVKNAQMDILSNMFCDWGFPRPMIAQWLSDSTNAEGVGVAFNQDLTSVRLYTHRWMWVDLDDIGAPVYKGYKFLKGGSLRLDEYLNYGDLRSGDNLAYAQSLNSRPEWLDRLIKWVGPDIPLLFTRTFNTARKSWLVTARYAQLDAGLIVGEAFRGRKLLHLAGGVDSSKGDFVTVYVSSKPSEIKEMII